MGSSSQREGMSSTSAGSALRLARLIVHLLGADGDTALCFLDQAKERSPAARLSSQFVQVFDAIGQLDRASPRAKRTRQRGGCVSPRSVTVEDDEHPLRPVEEREAVSAHLRAEKGADLETPTDSRQIVERPFRDEDLRPS